MNNLDKTPNNSDESLSKLEAANPANYNANSRLLVRALNDAFSQHTDLQEITSLQEITGKIEILLNECIDYDEIDYEKMVNVLAGIFEEYLEKLSMSKINLINSIKDILTIFADIYEITIDLVTENDNAFARWKQKKQKKRTPTLPYFSLPGDEEQPPSTRFDLPEEEPVPKPKPEPGSVGPEEPEITGLSTEGGLSTLSEDKDAYAKIMQVEDSIKIRNEALEEFREVFEEIFYDRFSLDDDQSLWDFLADANVISDAVNNLLTNPEGRYEYFADYYYKLSEKEKFHSYLRKYAFKMLRNDAIGHVQDIITINIPGHLYDETLDADDEKLPGIAAKLAEYFREELRKQKNSGEYDDTLRKLLFFYSQGVSKIDGTAGSDSEGSQMFGVGRWGVLLNEIVKVLEKMRGSKPTEDDEPPRLKSRTKTEMGIGISAQKESEVEGEDAGIDEFNQEINRILADEFEDEEKPDTSYSIFGEDAEGLEDTVVMPIPVATPQEKEVEPMPINLPKQEATLHIEESPPQKEVAEPMPVAAPKEIAKIILTPPPQKEIPLPKPTPPPKRQPEAVPIQIVKVDKDKDVDTERPTVPDYKTPTVLTRKTVQKRRSWVNYALTAVVAAGALVVGVVVKKLSDEDQATAHVTSSSTATGATAQPSTSVQSPEVKSAKTATTAASPSRAKAKTPESTEGGDLDEEIDKKEIPERFKELARRFPRIDRIINGKLVSNGSGIGEQIFSPFYDGASPEQRKALSKKKAEFNKSSGDYIRVNYHDSEKRKNILEDPTHPDHSYAKSVSRYINLGELPAPDGSESITQFKTFMEEMRDMGIEDVNSVSPKTELDVSGLTIMLELAKIRFPEAFKDKDTDKDTDEDPSDGKQGFKPLQDNDTYDLNHTIEHTPDQPTKYAKNAVCSEGAVTEECQRKIQPGSSKNVDIGFMSKKLAETEQKKAYANLMTEAIAKTRRGDILSTAPDTSDIDAKWELPAANVKDNVNPGSSENVDISFMRKKMAEVGQKKAYANLMTEAIAKAKRGDIQSTVPDTSDIDAQWELPPANVKEKVNPGSSENVRMDHIRAGAARYSESQRKNISRHLRLPQSFIVDRTKGELSIEILERQIQDSGQPETVVNAVMEALEQCENDGILFTIQSLEENKARFLLKTEVRRTLDEAADNAVKRLNKAA